MTEAMSTMSRLLKRRAGGVRTEFSEKPRGAGENHQQPATRWGGHVGL